MTEYSFDNSIRYRNARTRQTYVATSKLSVRMKGLGLFRAYNHLCCQCRNIAV